MTSGQKIAVWLQEHIADNNGSWSSEWLAAEIDAMIEIEKNKSKIAVDYVNQSCNHAS